MYNSHKYTK